MADNHPDNPKKLTFQAWFAVNIEENDLNFRFPQLFWAFLP